MFTHDGTRDLKDVLEAVNALQEYLPLVDDDLEAFPIPDSEFSLVLSFFLLLLLSLDHVLSLVVPLDGFIHFGMQVFDLVLQYLWVVVTYGVQNLAAFLENVRMRGVADFE